ncbi:hypothetical protein HDV00_011281 [Rhizophlyctis rosea]|nr:hypothetical protein HDV00_011281 [Rhizophlyctis rosea]
MDRLLHDPKTWAPITFIPDPKTLLFSKPFRILFIDPTEYNESVRLFEEKLQASHASKNEPVPEGLTFLISRQAGWYDSRVNPDRILVNLLVQILTITGENRAVWPLSTNELQAIWDVINGKTFFPLELPLSEAFSDEWESSDDGQKWRCKFFIGEDDASTGATSVKLAPLVGIARPPDKMGMRRVPKP